MTISFRLSPELTKRLATAARAQGVTKSEFVRTCLEQQLAQQDESTNLAWELGKDLFGKYSSGRSDLAEKHEEILREHYDKKRRSAGRGSNDRVV